MQNANGGVTGALHPESVCLRDLDGTRDEWYGGPEQSADRLDHTAVMVNAANSSEDFNSPDVSPAAGYAVGCVAAANRSKGTTAV